MATPDLVRLAYHAQWVCGAELIGFRTKTTGHVEPVGAAALASLVRRKDRQMRA